MAGTDISVDPLVISQGASNVRTVASEVSLARQASDAALADGAFGVLCTPLMLAPYLLAKTAADTMMDAGNDALTRAAKALDDTATDFSSTDTDGAGTFTAGMH